MLAISARRARIALITVSVALLLNGCASVQRAVIDTASPYFDAKTLDLGRVLPPPPTAGSATVQAEIEQILRIQAERTPAQVERARMDVAVSIYRFADALGDPAAFDEKRLPKLNSLFRKVLLEHAAVVVAAKRSFERPRPFVQDARIEPVIDTPAGDSYPSGHTMWGRWAGLLLADMLPEYRERILARADEYGFNRVIAGVHYPSDVEAGKLAGTALAAFLFASPRFQADYAEAKAEVRAALGLSPQPQRP